MCGIVGILDQQWIAQSIYDALTVLQHRGQDAAGMATADDERIYSRRANGLVRDVFRTRHMSHLKGSVGIGHVRYPTAGSYSQQEAQPLYVNSPYGIVLAHNGNLTNAKELRKILYQEDRRHLNTDSDSEILLNVFAHELLKCGSLNLTVADVFKAITQVHQRCRGGYAVVAVIHGFGLVAFRDPHGIRPLIYGQKTTDSGTATMIASESVALDALGYQAIANVAPGEAVIVQQDGQVSKAQCAKSPQLNPCLFEYVYLARPDSIIDEISVYKTRLRMGEFLAQRILTQMPNHDIDVVIPIPDTSRTAALPLAHKLGVKYREGFIKNRYIGRTFIMPGQAARQKSIKQKLNVIELEFKDKVVLLVDDSIVRGNTSHEIIQMARDAGAKKVYFASAAPAVRYPNVYGIDMPVADELLAHQRDEKQIAQKIGADHLFYQTLDDLIKAANIGNPAVKQFDTSVFDGQYVTGDIDEAYLQQLANARHSSQHHAEDDEQLSMDL